jgi:hypothetical protein
MTGGNRGNLFFPLLLLLSCRATTTRPYYQPLPGAAVAEIELAIPDATRALAEALAKDSIALQVIREQDGFIDSGWLAAVSLEHTGARPLGQDVVRVRAWVNPSKQFWSELVIEASYRPFDDPSRPERELDLPLPDDHALQKKIAAVIRRLVEAYGDATTLPAAPKPARPDTTKPKPDTAFGFRKAP